MLRRPDRPRLSWLAAAVLLLLALPSGAGAARLVGGHEQAALTHDFFHLRGPRGRAIVSIRSSSITPAWTVVRWVLPTPAGGGGTSQASPRVHASFFHAGRPGQPPAKVARELAAPFRVTILYSGAGSENVTYSQSYRSVCSGGGGFVEQETDTVSPMSWQIRYTVDLDHLLSAVRTAQGVVLVPSVGFDRGRSQLHAVERRSRTYQDQGCFSPPTNFGCTTTFRLSTDSGALGFRPGLGAEIGIPTRGAGQGKCAPEDYTLGPSLWDEGASTALVRSLGLVGGRLPANPYAAQKLSWPRNSAPAVDGTATSPCAGITSSCHDRFNWRGSVRLEPGFSG